MNSSVFNLLFYLEILENILSQNLIKLNIEFSVLNNVKYALPLTVHYCPEVRVNEKQTGCALTHLCKTMTEHIFLASFQLYVQTSRQQMN